MSQSWIIHSLLLLRDTYAYTPCEWVNALNGQNAIFEQQCINCALVCFVYILDDQTLVRCADHCSVKLVDKFPQRSLDLWPSIWPVDDAALCKCVDICVCAQNVCVSDTPQRYERAKEER